MRPIQVTDPAEPSHVSVSRRSLLQGGSLLGLSALASAGLAAAPASAAVASRTRFSETAAHLVPDYRPSQPHGWYQGSTVGGHVTSKDFEHNGKSYRVALLPFGRSGDSPYLVYEDVPADPAVGFKRNLAETFGTHYAFNYVGGFRGRHEFRVQSHSVYVSRPSETSPALDCGADLHVVYQPDPRKGDPAVNDNLQWIQVVKSLGPALDNLWRANPFYLAGGLTSVYGKKVCSFYDAPQIGVGGGPDPDVQFLAETFLVQDTGTKNAAGKDVVNIFGGIKWGWQIQEVTR
ncbi:MULTISPECIES: hypothetical protein [Streptosporangium]|uniref:Tat pathway signal sequence domain protein n=1 Tax=Streptosporangium brasiliense TaxID=47480 RepID=A0ABT9R0R1_9ACTN|nr:hypothetical protein [Streptosporangium brasiliense]MDP9862815.1 hypothetical protein [Streptosporangium brasiliense]